MASSAAATTPFTPPAKSRPSSTSTPGGSVSYEKFAPSKLHIFVILWRVERLFWKLKLTRKRLFYTTPCIFAGSSSQVGRLSRIAALTAGPTARASTVETAAPGTDDSSDFLLQAMSPPQISSNSNNYNNNNNNNNNKHHQQHQEEKTDESSVLVSATLEKTADTIDHLIQLLKHTTSLRLALRASINIADDISNRHAELLRHSGELSAAADRLQEEENMLTRHAEEIGLPLKHYDAVDRIGIAVGVLFKGKTTVRGLAKVKVDNDDFPLVLDQIDEAVAFFGRESGGKEALLQAERERGKGNNNQQLLSGNIEYFRRALALQEAALDLIREAVVERISNTSTQVADALNIPKVPIPADKLEASLVYTRYHGISSRSNRLLSLVRHRLNHGDAYAELLHLCRTTYCNSRENLLKQTIRFHMDSLKDQHGLVSLVFPLIFSVSVFCFTLLLLTKLIILGWNDEISSSLFDSLVHGGNLAVSRLFGG